MACWVVVVPASRSGASGGRSPTARPARAVVVANGAEGEPASHKDRVLMAHRPHLVIDGAILAAEAIGADEVVFYVGEEHVAARRAIGRAVEERTSELRGADPAASRRRSAMSPARRPPPCNFINTGDARPVTTPPRVSERGVGGAPTLVQNVESLAYAALIARFGEALVPIGGSRRDARHGPRHRHRCPAGPGCPRDRARHDGRRARGRSWVPAPTGIPAVVLGGYFGTWASIGEVWDMPLDPAVMTERGLSFGCGIVGLLPTEVCGVSATADIMAFLAAESAGQCGPCVHGLRAIGDATRRVADGRAGGSDVADIERWTSLVEGRGACHHPDGAAQLMVSALNVFGDEFVHHARTGRCSVTGARSRSAGGGSAPRRVGPDDPRPGRGRLDA